MASALCQNLVNIIKKAYPEQKHIPLHAPSFIGNEKKYVSSCIDSTFVSSVGSFVKDFEDKLAEYLGCKYAIAVVNGTSALQVALRVAGVGQGDEVITQSLSFVATANSIKYLGAYPVFVDASIESGICLDDLENFLEKNTYIDSDGNLINSNSKRKIKAIVPMHIFGHPCRLKKLIQLAKKYRLELVEDAAEALGSKVGDSYVGCFGKLGVFSFNGNKIITSGGGGAIVTNCKQTALRCKHLTTTAKVENSLEYFHDEIGYNYRMPNINAALALAQLENINEFIKGKRLLAHYYNENFKKIDEINFLVDREGTKSNYWLNALIFNDSKFKNEFLSIATKSNVQCRPLWVPLSKLPIYESYEKTALIKTLDAYERVVNIPSSYGALI